MSMDKSRYPANWDEISRRIRFERAGGKCEQCGAPHNHHIVRRISDPSIWHLITDEEAMYIHVEDLHEKAVKVILTVHHIGVDKPDGTPGDAHDKMDVREENLIALCQRCHLYADLPLHIANAKKTRAIKKAAAIEATGQLSLFGEQP